MGSFFSNLFNALFGEKEVQILILGLGMFLLINSIINISSDSNII